VEGENLGFASSGSSEDHDWTIESSDGLALLGIESG
jgi:hypothetical protein